MVKECKMKELIPLTINKYNGFSFTFFCLFLGFFGFSSKSVLTSGINMSHCFIDNMLD